MIEYFSCGFLPKKLLLWCLVMIILSKFQLWCTQKADSHWSWSGLRTSFVLLSPQDISVCTLSFPLDLKWGILVFLFHIQKLQWHHGEPKGHRTLPGTFPCWIQSSHCSMAYVVFFFFPLCSKSVNSPCPRQEVQGADPAVHLRPLLFECSCSQRRHPKPHPSQSCWAWIPSSMF